MILGEVGGRVALVAAVVAAWLSGILVTIGASMHELLDATDAEVLALLLLLVARELYALYNKSAAKDPWSQRVKRALRAMQHKPRDAGGVQKKAPPATRLKDKTEEAP